MSTRFIKSAALLLPLGLLTLASSATAGDHHSGASLRCADCHVMHFSQTHGYNNDGTGMYVDLGAAPVEHLLRDEVNNLCLSCHDGLSYAPDVLGANGGNSDVRAAGHLNRVGVGNAATGHTLDSLEVAPGSDPVWKAEDENGAGAGLNCTNCHQQHGYAGSGNNAYRNLKMDPGNNGYLSSVITYATGTNDLTKDVYQRAAKDYDETQMDWNEPDNAKSAIGNWCGGCHTNFHGDVGGAEIGGTGGSGFIRHPANGVNIGAIGGGHSNLDDYNAHVNKVKVMSEVGVWDPAGADVTPTCISCHKAHGNDNAFGLIYRSGSGTLTEEGDSNGSQLEHLCGQCHVQASAFAL